MLSYFFSAVCTGTNKSFTIRQKRSENPENLDDIFLPLQCQSTKWKETSIVYRLVNPLEKVRSSVCADITFKEVSWFLQKVWVLCPHGVCTRSMLSVPFQSFDNALNGN